MSILSIIDSVIDSLVDDAVSKKPKLSSIKPTDRVTCACGSTYLHKNQALHLRTIKHQLFENPDTKCVKMTCPCGGCFKQSSSRAHLKTKMHQEYIAA